MLRHRLPLVWARVLAGEVPAWRARRIAQKVLGAPGDVCADLHHRLKTYAGWTYRPLDPVTDPGVYLWDRSARLPLHPRPHRHRPIGNADC